MRGTCLQGHSSRRVRWGQLPIWPACLRGHRAGGGSCMQGLCFLAAFAALFGGFCRARSVGWCAKSSSGGCRTSGAAGCIRSGAGRSVHGAAQAGVQGMAQAGAPRAEKAGVHRAGQADADGQEGLRLVGSHRQALPPSMGRLFGGGQLGA